MTAKTGPRHPRVTFPLLDQFMATVSEQISVWEAPLPLGELPTVPPFPIEVLPPALVTFVEDAAAGLDCQVDYLGGPLLALAGAALGNSRGLCIKESWVELPALYLAVVGSGGSARSAALRTLAEPLHEAQALLMSEYEIQRKKYEQDYAQFRKASKRYNKAVDFMYPPPVEPERPVSHRLIAADITTAAVVKVLHDCPRGFVIVREDLSGWLRSLSNIGASAERHLYQAAWAGEPICVDRKTSREGPIRVPRPFLGIVGGLTAELLPGIRSAEGWGDGLLDRMLFVYPDARPAGQWSWNGLSEASLRTWTRMLADLQQLAPDGTGQGKSRPRAVRMNSEAEEAWRRFFDGLTEESAGENFPDYLRGAWGKLKRYGARLTLILHYLWGGGERIEAASVERAGRLVDYFREQTRKVYACLDVDPVLRKARRLLQWVHRAVEPGWTFGRAEAYRENRAHFRSPQELERPLRLLQELRHIRLVPLPERRVGGKRPLPRYEVHPLSRQVVEGGRKEEAERAEGK